MSIQGIYMFFKQVLHCVPHCHTNPAGSAKKMVFEVERLERELGHVTHAVRICLVHVTQLTVDMLQYLRVGLVFGSVATQRALNFVHHGCIRTPVLAELNKVRSCFVVVNQQHHLVKNVTGEEVVLHVGDLDSHWDAIVIRPLLRWRYNPEWSYCRCHALISVIIRTTDDAQAGLEAVV